MQMIVALSIKLCTDVLFTYLFIVLACACLIHHVSRMDKILERVGLG